MSDTEKKPSPWIPIVISILSLVTGVAGGGWVVYYLERQAAIDEQNQRYISDYLAPIRILLNDNKAIHSELHGSYLEPGGGILESYVEKVQRDGFENHALMLSRIRQLDSNNDEILLLLKQYSGHVLTNELSDQMNEYRKHAIAWSNRFDAIAEVIKTGKQFPFAMPFPKKFPPAIEAEIEARKNNT